MTPTLELWIDAQVVTLQECTGILSEVKNDVDKLIVQLRAIKKHVDSTIDFLERKRKFQ
jgi:hypothetical protein